MNDILVTGGTGFVGSHMIDYILKYAIRPEQKIYCTKRWLEDTKNVDHIDDKRFEFIDCDFNDAPSVFVCSVVAGVWKLTSGKL